MASLLYPDEYVVRFFFKNGLQSRPGRMLDVGCGGGRNATVFAAYGWQCEGVDCEPAPMASALAPQLNGAWRLHRHDLRDGMPPLPPGFSALLFCDSLYYLPEETMRRVLRECRTLAAPGAWWFLRMRDVSDSRYGNGERVGDNAYLLTDDHTGERGLLNVFYRREMLQAILRDELGAEPDSVWLRCDFDNWQNGVVVRNSDHIAWGRTQGGHTWRNEL